MKYKLFFALLILLGGVYLMAQEKLSLNGKWQFTYDNQNRGAADEYFKVKHQKKSWQSVNVPSFWGDAEYNGIGWYAKTFTLNKSWSGKKIALFFESVDDEAVVYLNGKKIIEHSGYNVSFNKDVTRDLLINKENHLVVKINDTGGAGGLCGDVYLREFAKAEDLLKSEYFSRESTTLPKWAENTLIYELYVRAHSEAGQFQNVIHDLPRLKEMGVGCIWLMPIFPIGEVKRKGKLGSPYAIKDFKKVNPEYGSQEDFQQLIDQAHAMDIKIILDIACNHSSWDNWLIKKHTEYYTKNAKGEIIFPPGTDWTDVADFDYDNPGLRDYMWDVLEYWVKEFDVDGYRADVAELVPDDFWQEAYDRLVKIKPDVLMLAEGAHPRLHVNGFHLTYAWNLRVAIARILSGEKPPEFLGEVLKRDHYRYPKNATHMIFTENHDKKRTPDFFGNDKALMAAVLNLSLPGVPMIYGGQEIGAEKTPSLFVQQPVDWQFNNNPYWDFYQKYFEIRQSNSAFSNGDFGLVQTTHPSEILAYSRKNSDNEIIIVGNVSDQASQVSLKISGSNPEVLLGNSISADSDLGFSVKLGVGEFSIIKVYP